MQRAQAAPGPAAHRAHALLWVLTWLLCMSPAAAGGTTSYNSAIDLASVRQAYWCGVGSVAATDSTPALSSLRNIVSWGQLVLPKYNPGTGSGPVCASLPE